MAKENRAIVSSVRMGDGTVFGQGMEDELAEAATAAQIDHLTKQGAIVGFVSEKAAKAADAKADDKKVK